MGFEVCLVGRKLPQSLPIVRPYQTLRMKLCFNKGAWFYANYNFSLFFRLLFMKVDVLHANDLDTLPAKYLVSKIRGLPLVYDSHEYFTEVPELINRPRIQKFWERIEMMIAPKLKYCFTVSQKIAESYQKKYGVDFQLLRKFPLLKNEDDISVEKFAVKTIIYQGALNVDRGLEELIKAMDDLENCQLLLAGDGDIRKELEKLVNELSLNNKVAFLGRLPFEELSQQTRKSHLGVSLEKAEGLNYKYAVPNKVFDYIHAGVPVLYAPLTELQSILAPYKVGEVLKSHQPSQLAQQLKAMLASSDYKKWVKNCEKAKQELNWENEVQSLKTVYREFE
jgi:glycosyltransferase involved in cell wall biosynthesis